MGRQTVQPHVQPLEAPVVHTRKLETLWFQVGGTICNLRCHHCFISCSPENTKFGFLTLADCTRYLEQAGELGVKEHYFTGGEPFANPQMCDILELALHYGPATVLTNATLLRDAIVQRLKEIQRESGHSLEIRVSLDGYSAEMNDPIRGEGTFGSTIDGTRRLVESGLRPILTITRTWEGCDEAVLGAFVKLLEDLGYHRPRLKILPLLKLGAEVGRSGGYCEQIRITKAMMAGYDQSRLMCSSARLATDQGVWVCPILPDFPEARVGDKLADSLHDYPLRHAACYTCWQHGAICSNATGCSGATPSS